MMTTDGSRFTSISNVLDESTGSPVAIQLESRKFSDARPKGSPASTSTLYPLPDSLTAHLAFEIAPALTAQRQHRPEHRKSQPNKTDPDGKSRRADDVELASG